MTDKDKIIVEEIKKIKSFDYKKIIKNLLINMEKQKLMVYLLHCIVMLIKKSKIV
ncbi:MAG: hypothetical protein L6V91_01175 [Bacilli bacterium]|nr:MAG: hypothetical protein L6V91_01175 [Bacilli bacterium]